jgi:drug/metabolite transporter (DMT)-like permease
VVELPLTLWGAALFLGGRLGRREWVPTVAMTAGLVALLICLAPRGGKPQVPASGWLLPGGVTLLLIVALTLAGRFRHEALRAALMGAGTGMAFGLSAALMKATTGAVAAGGILGALEAWQTYGAVAFGIAGTWLYQAAVHAGPLVASQPGITLLDPVVAILLGWLVFGEQFRSGGFIVGAVAGGVAMSLGVIALGWSPLLHSD